MVSSVCRLCTSPEFHLLLDLELEVELLFFWARMGIYGIIVIESTFRTGSSAIISSAFPSLDLDPALEL